MLTAADLVTAARSMLTGWEYVLGAHGQLDTATGLRESDCQYLVDRCCELTGVEAGLGPELPYEVAYMVAHTSFARVPANAQPWPGLIVVFLDPAAAGTVWYYPHTGIVSGPGTYISAYNSDLGIIESRIADTPYPVAFYLDTGLPGPYASEDDGTMQVHGIATLRDVNGAPAADLGHVDPRIRLLDPNGAYIIPTSASYPVGALSLAGVPGYVGPAWLTVADGEPAFILARNCSVALT